MASVEIHNRALQSLIGLQAWKGPVEIDARAQCKDEWSKDYACILVDIVEPEDELRDVIGDSLHTVYDSITAGVAKPFGTHATLVKGNDALPARGLIVHMRRLDDWTLEYEVYRRSSVRR